MLAVMSAVFRVTRQLVVLAVVAAGLVHGPACSFGVSLDGGFAADVAADSDDVGPVDAPDAVSVDGGLSRDADLPPEVECLDVQDCFAGEACEAFRCIPVFGDCRDDRDCQAGDACHAAQGRCVDSLCQFTPKEPGDACDDGSACTAQSVCDDALRCVDGRNTCALPEPRCRPEGDHVVVATGVIGCEGGEDPCRFHWVGAACAGCDTAECLCDLPCVPMGGGCTLGACANDECVYEPVADGTQCDGGRCLAGACVECLDEVDCATDDPCSVGSCSAVGECVVADARPMTACSRESDDGVCVDGQCAQCATDSDCTEFGPMCVDGVCVECTEPSECDEGAMACVDGRCVYCAVAADCDDDDDCTFDYCAPRVGHCRHARYDECAPP